MFEKAGTKFVVTVCKINGFVYTRYIDDITISSKEKISVEVQKVIEKIISLEGLKINRSKTVLLDAQKRHLQNHWNYNKKWSLIN